MYSPELNSAKKVSCISRPEGARTRQFHNLFGRILLWRVVRPVSQSEDENLGASIDDVHNMSLKHDFNESKT